MGVRGITKVRNEAHIIQATLDNWAEYCTDGIHVYDDGSTDDTPGICRAHPAVNEVISSDLTDPDRERAEWYCRHTVLHSARRFMDNSIGSNDWLCVFDADEHLEQFDVDVLEGEDRVVACMLFDAYITPADADMIGGGFTFDNGHTWRNRKHVAPEFQIMPYFYRLPRTWQEEAAFDFSVPDQRILVRSETMALHGKARHFGKAISIEHFEAKCDYYASEWPKYAEKWAARKGKAVHTVSDFGNPLVLWQDILSGKVEPMTTFIEREGEPVS